MAGFADIGGVNMIRGFARSYRAVMTTDTGAHDFVVIYVGIGYRCPGGRTGCMAGFTRVAGINVCCTTAAGDDSVVTTDAGSNHLRVINRSRRDRRP